MPDLPYTAPPTPLTTIVDLNSGGWCFTAADVTGRSCCPSVIAEKHGASLPVWRAIDRLRCHWRLDGVSCGGIPRRVVLVECDTYGKTTRITREVALRDG